MSITEYWIPHDQTSHSKNQQTDRVSSGDKTYSSNGQDPISIGHQPAIYLHDSFLQTAVQTSTTTSLANDQEMRYIPIHDLDTVQVDTTDMYLEKTH